MSAVGQEQPLTYDCFGAVTFKYLSDVVCRVKNSASG
jgi:hypothetical protein